MGRNSYHAPGRGRRMEPALAPEKGGDPRQWGGPAQSSSTRRAPILTITKSSTSHTVLFRIKRFPRTKQVFKPLSYRLKRFCETKRISRYTWYHLKRFSGTKCHNIHVWFHLKRLSGTKCLFRSTPFHLKRFRGTKLRRSCQAESRCRCL